MKQGNLSIKHADSIGETTKKLGWLFYSIWILLNLVQAYFTQVQDDEAYYWVYSKFLSWGYMDHPPMIALLIKVGSILLPGTLGLRLLSVLLGALTILVTEKLVNNINRFLFYAIAFSVAILQLAGFWAVPDVPLLFFTSLFLLCYRNFLQRDSWKNTVLLSVATACLFYSKYHGILVVFFTLLAYPKVLQKYRIYAAAFFVIIFFFPHLYWQYQHNWISFKFQLAGKRTAPYTINRTLDYIVGQVVIAGPIVGPILLYSSFAIHPKDTMERIFKFNVIGILVFFLVNSFRGNVEANWTAAALIPMLVLTHNFLQTHKGWRTWLYRLTPLSILVILFARVIMIFDILPTPAIVERFHSWKNWPRELERKTQGQPVVFLNSYQRASMYWYATGIPSFSINTYTERRNNYDFWPVEDSLLGKQVFIADIYNLSAYPDSMQARLWKIGYKQYTNYHSFSKIQLKPSSMRYKVNENGSVLIHFRSSIPPAYSSYLQNNPSINEQVKIGVFKDLFWVKDIPCAFTLRDLLVHPEQQVSIRSGLPRGNYEFVFTIGCLQDSFTTNSDRMKVQVY
jgi:hypothetical protein